MNENKDLNLDVDLAILKIEGNGHKIELDLVELSKLAENGKYDGNIDELPEVRFPFTTVVSTVVAVTTVLSCNRTCSC
ncbi:MAG: hypothetical protein ATN33_03680 [Epulopiscium sp. Nele67-Bin001]|nr:MAG: hypothetical protein ATN33_03680 [Epulopiscium sp. Nele67-Bin001]